MLKNKRLLTILVIFIATFIFFVMSKWALADEPPPIKDMLSWDIDNKRNLIIRYTDNSEYAYPIAFSKSVKTEPVKNMELLVFRTCGEHATEYAIQQTPIFWRRGPNDNWIGYKMEVK